MGEMFCSANGTSIQRGSERLWCPFASTCWHSGSKLTVYLLVQVYLQDKIKPWDLQLYPVNQKIEFITSYWRNIQLCWVWNPHKHYFFPKVHGYKYFSIWSWLFCACWRVQSNCFQMPCIPWVCSNIKGKVWASVRLEKQKIAGYSGTGKALILVRRCHFSLASVVVQHSSWLIPDIMLLSGCYVPFKPSFPQISAVMWATGC